MTLYKLNGVPNIAKGRLTVKVSSFWFISNRLYLDGNEIPKKDGRYYITDEKGDEQVIKLNRIGYDLIPQVSLNGSKSVPALAPPFNFLEHVWCVLPLFNLSILLTSGSVILCALATYINIRLMRRYKEYTRRYVYTYIITTLVAIILIKIRMYMGLGLPL